MKLTFGAFQYRDVTKRVVPISPKPLQMLVGEAIEDSLASALLGIQSFWHIKNWRYQISSSQSSTFRLNPIYSLRDAQLNPILSLGHQRIEIRFKGLSIPPKQIELASPSDCKTVEILREKKLKTQSNTTYIFFDLHVDLRNVIPSARDYNNCSCPWDLLWANGNWGRDPILFFVCRICGRFYVCECFREAIEIFKLQSLIDDPYRVQPPHLEFLAKYEKIVYRKRICHLCTKTPADFDSVFKLKYRTSFNANYLPYITKEVVCDPEYWEIIRHRRFTSPHDQKKFSKTFRAAENRIREVIGTHPIGFGWATEAQIYNMVKDLFPGEPVIHQGSPPWLGWMRFDVYLPARKVAIEYQGIQHFKPVEYFGGKAGFAMTKERDKRKFDLAKENGVRIIYLHYSEPVSRDKLKLMIQQGNSNDKKS